MCMPHQMPTYFIGLIQLVFGMTLGGLRFKPSRDGARSVARSARRNPPGGGVGAQRELRELVGDGELAEPGLRRKLVAEADPVVEDPEHHHELSARRRDFGD